MPGKEEVMTTLELISGGRLHLKRDRLREAIKSFRIVLKKEPDNEEALSSLAEAYARQGSYDAAEEILKKLEVINPANIHGLFISAFICVQEGAYEEAISEYKRIIYSQPHNARAYLLLGDVYWKAGKKAGAILAWKKAMEENKEGDIAELARCELEKLKEVT